MSEKPAHEQRHDEAVKAHQALIERCVVGLGYINAACLIVREQQGQVGTVLQHAAITLKHVNPTASAAISNTCVAIDNLTSNVVQRTANLREALAAIPEPTPPPPTPTPGYIPDPALWYVVEHALVCSVFQALSARGEAHDPIDANSRPNDSTPFTLGIARTASDSIHARLSLPYGKNFFVDDSLPGDPVRSVREATNCIVAMLREECKEGMAFDKALSAEEPSPSTDEEPAAEAVSPIPVP